MKILLLTDKPNWAYHSIAKALVKYNPYPDIQISVMHIKKNKKAIRRKYKNFDRILVMGWQNYKLVDFIPKQLVQVGIHSFHSWDKKKTTPEADVDPPKSLIKYLRSFNGVNAVSKRLTNLFRRHKVPVVYTPNGVDTDIFRPKPKEIDTTLTVGYSGSKAHDWRKGVSAFIVPSAKRAGCKVELAMLSTKKYVPLEDMPRFYDGVDVYVCASSSEGMSLSVLEAAACGCPIIGTKISGNTEIIKNGETGFLVDRKVSDIVAKLELLKSPGVLKNMSSNVAKDIKNNWCWSKRAKAWIDYLRK